MGLTKGKNKIKKGFKEKSKTKRVFSKKHYLS